MFENQIIQQSAVVPYLFSNNQQRKEGKASEFENPDDIQIVLITSTRSGSWIIPKGMLEPDLSPWDSAAKEAHEEAGVLGRVDERMLCEYEYEKCCLCKVKVYPLRVEKILDDWDEIEERERRIVKLSEATTMVEPVLQPVLSAFREFIENA